MFCEKCGSQIPEGSKFCDKCGAPTGSPWQQQDQQPIPQPVPQPIAEEEAPTESLYQYNYNQQQQAQQQSTVQQQLVHQPVQPPVPQYRPVTPAVKQPMPGKFKKLILFGGIGVAVIAIVLIALFGFIIPALNTVDVSRYVRVTFTSGSNETVYDGEITGRASVSASDIYIDKLGDAETKKLVESRKKISSGKYTYDDLLKDSGSLSKSSAVSAIVGELEIDCKILGQEKSDSTSDGNSSSDSKGSSSTFDHAKKTDTLLVTIKWPKEPIALKEIEQKEALAGLHFDKSDKTIEIELEDQLNTGSMKIVDKVEVDFVKYITDKKLIKIKGTPDNYPGAYLGEFEYKQGNYTFTNKSDKKTSYSDYNTITVTNSKDTSDDHTFYVNFDSVEDAVENDEVEYKINGDNEHLYNTDVFFTKTTGSFKYKPNHALTLDEAKKNNETIADTFKRDINNVDSSIKDSSRVSVQEIFFCVENDSPDDEEAMLYIFYKNTATGKYKYAKLTHNYMADGEFYSQSASDSWSTYDSLANSKEYVSPFSKYSKDDYTTTKVY